MRKTRANNVVEIFAFFDFVESIASTYSVDKKRNYPLPDSFCFDELFVCLDILLESEHFQILSRTLLFIFRMSFRFRGVHRRKLFADLLLRKYFYHLFLHWCSDVRFLFHQILVYCLNRTGIGNRKIPRQSIESPTPPASKPSVLSSFGRTLTNILTSPDYLS